VTAALLALLVVVLSLAALLARSAAAASATLARLTAPFPVSVLEPHARGTARSHLRSCVLRMLVSYVRAVAPLTVLVVGATTVLAPMVGLAGIAPARHVLLAGWVTEAVVAALVSAAVLWSQARPGDDARLPGALGRLIPFSPEDAQVDLPPRVRIELDAAVRHHQQRTQQQRLDGAAAEAGSALGRVADLPPEELRERVARQVALWAGDATPGRIAGDRAFREVMEQVDHLFGQLERELADGVPAGTARGFWYAAVLRTVRHAAGARALAGVLVAPGPSGLRPVPYAVVGGVSRAAGPVPAPPSVPAPAPFLAPLPEVEGIPAPAAPGMSGAPGVPGVPGVPDTPGAAGVPAAAGMPGAAGAPEGQPGAMRQDGHSEVIDLRRSQSRRRRGSASHRHGA
jgi:hypothetical protein